MTTHEASSLDAKAATIQVAAPDSGVHQPGTEDHTPRKRAVIYLRVSTPRQARTDVGSDGFSLETQRAKAYAEAAKLDAYVLDEYLDTETGTNTTGRRQLQAMLTRLEAQRDIDYVIIFKLDRFARNRLDDAQMTLLIHQAGAQLVSCSEHIDSSRVGKLNHGILASVNEYFSDNLSHELREKMMTKVKKGGTPGVCSLGYLNVRENIDGKNIGIVHVDPERGPIIQWALEAFATGDYTIISLHEQLVALGLTTRPTARQGGKLVTKSFVGRMLRNPYYTGIVTWGGVQVKGNHPPLISIETFARNQAILDSHRPGEKQRTHPHYLRSSIVCRRCGSRMCFTKAKGRGGVYDYFFCIGRHQKRNECDLPYLLVPNVETGIEEHYQTKRLTDDQIETLRQKLLDALDTRSAHAKRETKRQTKRVQVLEAQRDKLLDAFLVGSVPVDVLKRKQDTLTTEIGHAEAGLRAANMETETVEGLIHKALNMLRDAHWAYQHASPQGRRHWNQAFFDFIEVDHEGQIYSRLAEPFAQLVEDELRRRTDWDLSDPEPTSSAQGLKDDHLAERVGFEPTVAVTPHLLSREARSTGLWHLSMLCGAS